MASPGRDDVVVDRDAGGDEGGDQDDGDERQEDQRPDRGAGAARRRGAAAGPTHRPRWGRRRGGGGRRGVPVGGRVRVGHTRDGERRCCHGCGPQTAAPSCAGAASPLAGHRGDAAAGPARARRSRPWRAGGRPGRAGPPGRARRPTTSPPRSTGGPPALRRRAVEAAPAVRGPGLALGAARRRDRRARRPRPAGRGGRRLVPGRAAPPPGRARAGRAPQPATATPAAARPPSPRWAPSATPPGCPPCSPRSATSRRCGAGRRWRWPASTTRRVEPALRAAAADRDWQVRQAAEELLDDGLRRARR